MNKYGSSQFKDVNALSITKFCLILFVVLIHCNIPYTWHVNKSGLETISFIVSFIRVSVPCFFIISGYLYFSSITKFTYQLYINKSFKRIHSLFIPYILWNTIFLGYLVLRACFDTHSLHEIFPFEKNFLLNFLFIIKGYWNFENGYPYAFAFWFIRNLIIFCALSPIVYCLSKKYYLFVFFIFSLLLCNIDLFGFEYFVFGAFLRYNYSFSKIRSLKVLISTGVLWIVFAFISYYYSINYNILEFIESFMAVLFLLNISEILMIKINYRILKRCVSYTFYIYAIHQFFASPLKKIYRTIFDLDTYWGVIGFYFICFLSLIIVSLVIMKLLFKISPKLTNILSGGRSLQ